MLFVYENTNCYLRLHLHHGNLLYKYNNILYDGFQSTTLSSSFTLKYVNRKYKEWRLTRLMGQVKIPRCKIFLKIEGMVDFWGRNLNSI